MLQISPSSVFAFLRNAGSIASIVIGASNVGGLPPAVRAVLVAIGGVIQGVEHLNGGAAPAPTRPAAAPQAASTAPVAAARPAVPPAPPGA